jgi:hypothetical protein
MIRLLRYWGYLAFALAVYGWVTHAFQLTIILALSVATAAYSLLAAPVWCGAVTRKGELCRRNSSGILLGCHLREHKWQKIKMTFALAGWRTINRGLWSSPREGMNTLTGIAAVASAIAAGVATLIQAHS